LTNHHVVFGDAAKPDGGMTAFFNAVEPDGISTRQIRAVPVAWGNRHTNDRVVEDWALLRLDECIGHDVGWMEFGALTTEAALALTVVEAGFGGDKDRRFLWIDPDCRLYRPDIMGFSG